MPNVNEIPNEEWLKPSDREIDPQLKKIIKETWSQPPTAVQIGIALDLAVYGSLTSDFVIRVWQLMFEDAVVVDGRPIEEIRAEIKSLSGIPD